MSFWSIMTLISVTVVGRVNITIDLEMAMSSLHRAHPEFVGAETASCGLGAQRDQTWEERFLMTEDDADGRDADVPHVRGEIARATRLQHFSAQRA